MAESREQNKPKQTGGDPRQHNQTSTGRGESGSAREETSRGASHSSTSTGRSSNESDSRATRSGGDEGLTMGTNGGEKIGSSPSGSRDKKDASGQQKERKAS